jgi:hypothetical protein
MRLARFETFDSSIFVRVLCYRGIHLAILIVWAINRQKWEKLVRVW